jgi:hypothetical protein
MKDVACSDCVVSLLLGPVDLKADYGVLGVLADAGLVPPLRLISGMAQGDLDTERNTRRSTG